MKEFTDFFTDETYVFTLIIYKTYNSDNIILSNIKIIVKTSVISYKLLKYKDLSLTKNAEKLSEHKSSDYIIEITDSNVLSYKLLYNLFNTKLIMLQNYIDKVLKKDRIYHSVSSTEASVLFI